jgi:hypothetical protein
MARWFMATPAFETIEQTNGLELRRYPFRIEARHDVQATDLVAALDAGFTRLECYMFGANAESETLGCTRPVLTTMRDGVYTMSFVMPPHRTMASLPHPDDLRVTLREVPERTIAAYPFHGDFSRDNIAFQERKFLRALVDAGVVAKGSIALATYDSPTTLPRLRKTELWIEVV